MWNGYFQSEELNYFLGIQFELCDGVRHLELVEVEPTLDVIIISGTTIAFIDFYLIELYRNRYHCHTQYLGL